MTARRRKGWLAVPLLAIGAVAGYALHDLRVDGTKDDSEPARGRLGLVQKDLRRATRELRSARRQLERGRLSIPTISGSGPREIGTVSLPIDGAVEWSATGGFLLTTPRAILIDSRKGRGRRVLKAGDYRLEVLSRGPWSLRITPK